MNILPKKLFKGDQFWPGVQTVILFFTLIAAVCIGNTQNRINNQLLKLNNFPSVGVVYQAERDEIQILNLGKFDITLYEYEIGGHTENLSQTLLISTGALIAAPFTDVFLSKIRERDSRDTSSSILFKYYFKTPSSEKYMLSGNFILSGTGSELIVRTQLNDLVKID